jgi:hypothetical protein
MSGSSQNPNQCLIVLGVHRSGTSALAGVLSMLGADPGPSLLPAREDNPKGFWEHAEIVAVHEKLLDHLGSAWDDELPLADGWWRQAGVSSYRDALRGIVQRDFSRSALWILKDPRICRLLPLWLDILRDVGARPHFVICLREPGEVAQSLERRDGIPNAKAQLLWLEHLLEAERWSRNYPRVAIAYDQLLADWRAAAQHIVQVLSLPIRIDDPKVNAQIEGFLEPSLRHHSGTGPEQDDHAISKLAREVYQVAKTAPTDSLADALSFAAERVGQMSALIAPWAVRMRTLDRRAKEREGRLKELEGQVAHLEQLLGRVNSSLSWRITRPFRVIGRFLSIVK